MSDALYKALCNGDLDAASARLSKGETLDWEQYLEAIRKAQGRADDEGLPVIQWFEKKIKPHQIKDLFFPNGATYSALGWVSLNASLYLRNDAFTASAVVLAAMASRGNLINAPVCHLRHQAQKQPRATTEGWRLLHAAAEAKNIPFMVKLLELGAHPNGFDPAVLSEDPTKGRMAHWHWTESFRKPPTCPPALLCADSSQALELLSSAGADLSLRGVTADHPRPVSVLELSLKAIRAHWQAGDRDEANALARFWLDKAQPAQLAGLARDKDLCPAEGMLRLKGVSAAADELFAPGQGGSLDRLRFTRSPFERRFGRAAVGALRDRDFPAFSASLRAAARSGIAPEEWTLNGRHIAIVALSFCAGLPERQSRETLFGAGSDRDQQAAALIPLIAELIGPRAIFAPFPKEPGSLAHYCALGFGSAANQACARLASSGRLGLGSLSEFQAGSGFAPHAAGVPIPLAENPLNWALWTQNQAALAAWSASGSALRDLNDLFPSSLPPFELALERGAFGLCSALARAGCSLDAPSSKPGLSLRDLTLAALEDQDTVRAQTLRSILSYSEQAVLESVVSISKPRSL